MNNEILDDCKQFADRHRGKNRLSGPHWSTIIRFAPLYDEAVRLQKRIAELEQERRWIPISERLPEIFGWYLVYGRDASTRRNINVEYFRLNSKTFSGGLHITHWKYLPQSPSEKE